MWREVALQKRGKGLWPVLTKQYEIWLLSTPFIYLNIFYFRPLWPLVCLKYLNSHYNPHSRNHPQECITPAESQHSWCYIPGGLESHYLKSLTVFWDLFEKMCSRTRSLACQNLSHAHQYQAKSDYLPSRLSSNINNGFCFPYFICPKHYPNFVTIMQQSSRLHLKKQEPLALRQL